MTPFPTPPGGHALVIGGGIAGLATARVLAERFARVTLLERDAFPDGPALRPGVPQARHVHNLLVRGARALELLFPGLGDDLAAAGAPAICWTTDSLAIVAAEPLPRFPSDLAAHPSSRALLEWVLRRRLEADPRVAILPSREVVALLHDPAAGRVLGVVARPRGGHQAGDTVELRADLTVDASGRDTRTPAWLRDLGYGVVATSVVNASLGYASRTYRRSTAPGRDWQALFINTRPPEMPRGGVIFPIEDDAWIVTLAGVAGDYPPTDEPGFLAFARSVAEGRITEALAGAEPLGPISGYRRTENILRHYDRLPRWPKGFAALGDAVCAFNPVYGQGMTAGALGAWCLAATLRRAPAADPGAATAQFQRRLARVNATPWLLATSEDYRWPTTVGGRPSPAVRLIHRYVNHVLQIAAESEAAAYTFASVVHLTLPPVALLRPAVLLPVLRHALRGALLPKPRSRRGGTAVR